jgi:hypothetical protein
MKIVMNTVIRDDNIFLIVEFWEEYLLRKFLGGAHNRDEDKRISTRVHIICSTEYRGMRIIDRSRTRTRGR